MKAILLAAGEGKRMRPLTLVKPKPMIEVLGKPLLVHIIESLPDAITEIILVIGYQGEAIEKYFGGSFAGKKITYLWQKEALGTAHALFLCKEHIEKGEKFLFMFADDLHSKDAMTRLIKHPLGVLVAEHADPKRFGVVVAGKDNKIIEIEEKPLQPKSNLVVSGVYVFDDRIFDYQLVKNERLGEYFLPEVVEQMLRNHAMYIERTEFWHPIGYPYDIDKAEEILAKKYPISEQRRHTIPLIILAGGKGTRMPESEKHRPKLMANIMGAPRAMETIGEKPMLQHQIEWAERQGFKNIILSLGYMADQIIAWLKEQKLSHIRYVVEDKPLGTGGALKLAAQGITAPFIAINGDDIADVNYAGLIRHGAEGKYNVVTGMEIGDARAYGLIECDEHKKICAFKEKDPTAVSGIVNIGHYYLKPEIFEGMPEKFSMEYDLFPKLVAKGELVLMKHMGNYWFGCGTPETLQATREYFSKSH
ncbi:MAG: sugar phosphate nucleotidyltransferase [bacterium]|nr:sugar phosphate nucleotidyltransferase [bacterium]